MDLRSWIPERFTPVVMVITTPEAEEMVQLSNGLTVVEMLRPQGAFHNLSGAAFKLLSSDKTLLAHQLCSLRSPKNLENGAQCLCARSASSPIASASCSCACITRRRCSSLRRRCACGLLPQWLLFLQPPV